MVKQIWRKKDTLRYFSLNSSIPVCYEHRIIERDVEVYEKVPFDSLDWNSFWSYYSQVKYPNCESMKATYDRVKPFLDELKQDNKNGDILIVSFLF